MNVWLYTFLLIFAIFAVTYGGVVTGYNTFRQDAQGQQYRLSMRYIWANPRIGFLQSYFWNVVVKFMATFYCIEVGRPLLGYLVLLDQFMPMFVMLAYVVLYKWLKLAK